MNNFMVLFASIVIFSSHCCLSQEAEKTMKKYCDTSLSDEKIKELEKCESDAPEEVKQAVLQCLKVVNTEAKYTDFRKTICDPKSRKTYSECCQNSEEFKALDKKYDFQEISAKSYKCADSVLSSKS